MEEKERVEEGAGVGRDEVEQEGRDEKTTGAAHSNERISRARTRLIRWLKVPLAAWATLRDSIARCRRGFEMKNLARSQFHTLHLPSSYPDQRLLDQYNEAAIRESGANGRARLPT